MQNRIQRFLGLQDFLTLNQNTEQDSRIFRITGFLMYRPEIG